MTTKIKSLKIIGCPECRKRFIDSKSVNIHLKKSHDAKYKIYIGAKSRFYARTTLILQVA